MKLVYQLEPYARNGAQRRPDQVLSTTRQPRRVQRETGFPRQR